MHRTSLPALLALAAAAGTSCATPRQYREYPTPFSAAQLAQENSGEALVWYLRQRDATPAVCDAAASGPHVALATPEDTQDLVDGLARGLDPQAFRACTERLLARMPPAFAADFFDQMGAAYRALLRNERLETDPALRARLDALHRVYVDRPTGLGPRPERMRELADELRGAMLARRFGPTGRRYGDDLLGTLDLEQGRWANRAVDGAMLDRLQREGNVTLLQRFARRLPNAALRREATRRIVRLRIAASEFPEVREHAEEVERVVMDRGRYPIPTARYQPRGATLDALRVPARGVVVRQDVYGGTAALLSFVTDPRDVSVLPELPFRGGLRFELEGVSRPVTLCGPRTEYDPTPCVLSSEVRIDNPLAYLEEDGAFRLRERIATDDVLALATRGERFDMPIRIGDRALLTVTWRLRFERPQDFVLEGAQGGSAGPDMRVEVDARQPGRLIYRVVADRQYIAVVEATEAADFAVVSRGGRGAAGEPGIPGRDGARGYDGQSASCPSTQATGGGAGGPGGDGTNGGPGGPGGEGGSVVVDARCPPELCGSLQLMLQRTVHAPGGAGGPGGPGGAAGRGGYGGRGGAGTSCSSPSYSGSSTSSSSSYSLPGASDGPRGPDGRPGLDGPDGPPGPVGRVAIRLVPGI